MKVLVLNGSYMESPAIEELFSRLLHKLDKLQTSNQLHIINLSEFEDNIAYCQGCFGCWVKTPGKCIIPDFAADIARQDINSDLVVYFTPITFGGYSSLLKHALDRIICLISPYFERFKGEIHHKKRYERYPHLLGIGYKKGLSKDEAAAFQRLIARNALNNRAPEAMAIPIDLASDSSDFLVDIEQFFAKVEAI